MYQLDSSKYAHVIPLADAAGVEFPIIRAVLENRQEGQVFADDDLNPRTAIVCHKFGFLTILNRHETILSSDEVLRILLHGKEISPQYRLWYDPGAAFIPLLKPYIDAGKVRIRERIRYRFRDAVLDVPEPPNGWRIRSLERSDLPKVVAFKLDFPERFWGSANNFFSQAFAVVAVQGEEVGSICYPAAIGAGKAEIDVATLEHARGKLLAHIVSQRFIREILRRGIEPTWDCFAANEPSVRLAQHLDFKENRRYSFVTFNRF